jgi:hypothetical protein
LRFSWPGCWLFFQAVLASPGFRLWSAALPTRSLFFEEILASFSAQSGVPVMLIRQTTDSAQRKQGILLALRGLSLTLMSCWWM